MTYRLVLFLFLSYQPEYCAFSCRCLCLCFCRRRSCWLFVLKVSTINYKLMCVFNKYKQTNIQQLLLACATYRSAGRPAVWPNDELGDQSKQLEMYGQEVQPTNLNQPANRCLRHLHFKHTPTNVPSSLLPDPPATFWKKYYMIS